MNRVFAVSAERVEEAADVLTRSLVVDPFYLMLVPDDPAERLAVARMLLAAAIAEVIASPDRGWIHAVGEPIAGVALWLRRPAADEAPGRAPAPPRTGGIRQRLGSDARERADAFQTTLARLRRIGRPERHAYLDSIGVLAEQRRRGIATALLEAGHRAADTEALPCALDTLTAENVAFYRNRGYDVAAEGDVPGAEVHIWTMRRRRLPAAVQSGPGTASWVRRTRATPE